MVADDDGRGEVARLHARIESLRREVYSRAGSESPLTEAVDPASGELVRLTAAERQLRAAERELQAIVSALPRPKPPAEPAVAAPQVRETEDAADGLAGPSPDARAPRPRRVVAALVAAAVLLAAVSFVAGDVTAGRDASGGGAPSPGARPSTATPVPGRAAGLAVFDAPQRVEDIPPVLLGFGVAPATTRSFGNVGATPGVGRTYVARTVTGLVCLAIVLPDLTSSMSCVAGDRFSAEGIRLRVTTSQMVPSAGSGGQPEVAFYEYYWSRDGTLSVESNVLHFPSAPHA